MLVEAAYLLDTYLSLSSFKETHTGDNCYASKVLLVLRKQPNPCLATSVLYLELTSSSWKNLH